MGSDDKVQPKVNIKTTGESVTETLDTQPVKLHSDDSDISDDECQTLKSQVAVMRALKTMLKNWWRWNKWVNFAR